MKNRIITFYSIITFIIHAKYGLSLVIYDYDYGTADIKNGRLRVTLYLKYYNALDVRKGSIKTCDFASIDPKTLTCDYTSFSRMCILNQNLMGLRNVSNYKGVAKKSFDVDKVRHETERPGLDKEFDCGKIDDVNLPEGNELVYNVDTYPRLTAQEAKYTNMFQFTIVSGDRNFRNGPTSQDWPFEKFSIYVDAGLILFNEDIHWYHKEEINILQSVSREEYVTRVDCGKGYHGNKCWYSCIDSYRMTCNCVPIYRSSGIPCPSYCQPGWLKQYKLMLVDGQYEMIVRCDSMDICSNILNPIPVDCPVPKTCFPVNNDTYYCEIVSIQIESSGISKNITSHVFFYEETITIELNKDLFQHKDIIVNITEALNTSDAVFILGILLIKFDLSKDGFTVSGLSEIDNNLSFTYDIVFKAWEKSMEKIKYFRIYRRPYMVTVYRFDNGTALNNYVLLGENLKSVTDALPLYRTVTQWISKSLVFPFNFGESVKIPDDTLPGTGTLFCKTSLIAKERDTTYAEKQYFFFVKIFSYLGWNVTNNVLKKNTTVACSAHAYIQYYLSIVQINGPSTMLIVGRMVHIQDSPGGTYEFVCYFNSYINLRYSAYLKFKLRVNASSICFFLYANILGSIVQCGHDGFLQDEYKTEVTFYMEENSGYTIKAQGEKYIRIPYSLANLKYKITCMVVLLELNAVILEDSIKNVLYMTTRNRYVLSEKNKLCLRFDEYVELPPLIQYSDKSVTLAHYLFYLYESQSFHFVEIPLCLLLSAFPFIAISILTKCTIQLANKSSIMNKHTKAVIKKLKIRAINDKLRRESRKPSSIRKSQDYFRASFINKRTSVIQMLDRFDSYN